jgi:hypothetical protein
LPNWPDIQQRLARVADQQLFFVGGAPRSGTTWLQYLLDSHPEVSCRGEAAFMKHLPGPLAKGLADWSAALRAKNEKLFGPAPGYPLPPEDDAEALLATEILLSLARQAEARQVCAVGEKTPENVFFFAQLKRLFPAAKFVGIARDPRDVLTSAWHFFHRVGPGEDEVAAKLAFVRNAVPALHYGTTAMLDLLAAYPNDCLVVTYEGMLATPQACSASSASTMGRRWWRIASRAPASPPFPAGARRGRGGTARSSARAWPATGASRSMPR